MDDCIYREAVIRIVCEDCNRVFPDEPCEPRECSLLKALEAIPAADVRHVVTCDVCAWHVDDGNHYCKKWRKLCPDNADFFCAYGERPNCGAKMEES